MIGEAMLKAFKGVTEFYANGTVYITDCCGVQKLEKTQLSDRKSEKQWR
jgi:hypothetical protein